MAVLKVGTLGAARITPTALVRPARVVSEVVVTAVAARDPARAREFADKHGIRTVHDSYEALIADPEVDAIYNPLPNSLHAPWTLLAIAGGKHVLCEKPFASNEAGRIRASLWSAQRLRISARAVGERGEIRVLNYLAPQAFSLLRTRTSQTALWERVRDHTATYVYQLRAFAAAVLRGEPVITNAEDAVANMRQIDSVYRAAGLPPRGQQDSAGDQDQLRSPVSCSNGAGPTTSGSGRPTTDSSLPSYETRDRT